MVGLHTVTNGPPGLPIPVGAIIRTLTYAYDAAGNLSTASDGRSYAYDPAGKMVRDQKAGVTSAHLYNWEGRRTASVTGAASVAYIHDGRSLLVEYLNGSVSRSYHYGERLTAIEAGAAKYGLHLDPLGSVVEVTGDAGPDCARTYDPWGEFNENGPCAADPKLAYTGHEYDQTSGLYNFGARYYDPATARFTTLDPYFGDTSTPPSLHKYLYAYANPYRWVDLEGYANNGFGVSLGAADVCGTLDLESNNLVVNSVLNVVNNTLNTGGLLVNTVTNASNDLVNAVAGVAHLAGVQVEKALDSTIGPSNRRELETTVFVLGMVSPAGVVESGIDGLRSVWSPVGKLLRGNGAKAITPPSVGPSATGGKSIAARANAERVLIGDRPPYAQGSSAREITLGTERTFVRVHSVEKRSAGGWIMRSKEIAGLTKEQIRDKFALPETPSFVSEVAVPAGSRLRVGTAGEQAGWGSGGGVQYELLDRLQESAFTGTRRLK